MKKQRRSKNVVAKDLVTNGIYRAKTFVDRKKRDKTKDRRGDWDVPTDRKFF